MNKTTSSKIVALFAAAALTVSSVVTSAMATEEPQFIARGGGEAITANADGSVTVQTGGHAGGGVKSAKAHLADGLSVTLNYNVSNAAACPTKAICNKRSICGMDLERSAKANGSGEGI